MYKKFRNKEVASAARGLIGLFREVNPAMLEKRDRGRGADLQAAPLSYGAARMHSRVEGAELLQVLLMPLQALISRGQNMILCDSSIRQLVRALLLFITIWEVC
jgi:hypothetical protein